MKNSKLKQLRQADWRTVKHYHLLIWMIIVWRLLKPNTKSFDKRIQIIQTAIAKASCNILEIVNTLQSKETTEVSEDKHDQLTKLSKSSLALLGHKFHNLCVRHWELQKPDVAWKYSGLLVADVPHNQYLYGGNTNVEKLIKDIGTSQQVANAMRGRLKTVGDQAIYISTA